MLKLKQYMNRQTVLEFFGLAAVLIVVGYFMHYEIDSLLKKSLEESIQLHSKTVAYSLSYQFEQEVNEMQTDASLLSRRKVSLEDLLEVSSTNVPGLKMGLVDSEGAVMVGDPLDRKLFTLVRKSLDGKPVVEYLTNFGIIFAVPVHYNNQTYILYKRYRDDALRKKFGVLSYNGVGTLLLLRNYDNWTILSSGEKLINLTSEMRPGWVKLAEKLSTGQTSVSVFHEFDGQRYFMHCSKLPGEYGVFLISGYVPWKSAAVGIDYIYQVMLVTFGCMILFLVMAGRYMFKARESESLRHEKILADTANKTKSDFLSNMSHEIRTPINAILGMDEMILRESKESFTLEYAENLRHAGVSLLGIVNDILDFSKIEAGKMEIIPVEYHISSILNDLINMVQTRANKKGLKFIAKANPNIPSVLYGDEIRIKQIITNILTNAVKYTEKGSVTLTVEYKDIADDKIYLIVSVKDTGIGIKEEDISKLFSAFERIEEKRNRTIEGTGLGMNITQQLLRLMNTKLNVESVYGQGSTFSFELEQKVVNREPIGDFEEAFKRSLAQHKEYHEKFTAPNARILVVDDTVMNLTVVKGLLKQTKIQIDTCESGYECLKMVAKAKYDVIFLDHRMPGMDGIETLKAMREMTDNQNVNTPVISLTANAISGAREQYIEAGFQDYLTKPIDSAHLENLLIKYLPPYKIEAGGTEETVSETPQEEFELPEWLSEVKGLSVKEGIKHCGGVEEYLEAVKIFANSINTASGEIENYYKNEDWKNYTTKVHALKSSARVIGAQELSERAKRLEDAGNSNYINEIHEDTGPLLKLYRSYAEALKPLIEVEGDDEDKPLISDEELAEAYESLKDFASSFDYDSAQFVIQSLDEYKLPEEEAQRYKKIKEAVSKLDWDAVNKLLNK